MAPTKTDPEGETEPANNSILSSDLNVSNVSETEHEPYFEPVVQLPEVQVRTNEEEEEEMIKMRCKLYLFHNEREPAEWKERGTGDVKILRHRGNNTVRVVMRQEKTLKVRANHRICPYMELRRSCDSKRAFVWTSRGDVADDADKPTARTFAIRFAQAQTAESFKNKFDEAVCLATLSSAAEAKGSPKMSSPRVTSKPSLAEPVLGLEMKSTSKSPKTESKISSEVKVAIASEESVDLAKRLLENLTVSTEK